MNFINFSLHERVFLFHFFFFSLFHFWQTISLFVAFSVCGFFFFFIDFGKTSVLITSIFCSILSSTGTQIAHNLHLLKLSQSFWMYSSLHVIFFPLHFNLSSVYWLIFKFTDSFPSCVQSTGEPIKSILACCLLF